MISISKQCSQPSHETHDEPEQGQPLEHAGRYDILTAAESVNSPCDHLAVHKLLDTPSPATKHTWGPFVDLKTLAREITKGKGKEHHVRSHILGGDAI